MSSEKQNPDKLDRLLDGALESYSQAEPQPGLEDRVLENLQTAKHSRSWTFAGFGWQQMASAMAAVLVIGVVLYVVYRPSPQLPGPANQVVVERKSTPANVISANPRVGTPENKNTKKTAPAVEKQMIAVARTPTVVPPAPLSEQEKLALRFVRLVESASAKVSAGDARGLTELVIEPLKIEPLNKDDGSKEDVKDQTH